MIIAAILIRRDDAETLSHPRYAQLLALLTPALHRLNTALSPSPPLKLADLPPLADMCAFDAQAKGTEWKGWSEWCGIFRAKEWEVLGYLRDAERYYHVGGGGVSLQSLNIACEAGGGGRDAEQRRSDEVTACQDKRMRWTGV